MTEQGMVELAERDAFERELRIRIWNACKARNMKDDAAYQVINREIARIKTEAAAALRATASMKEGE